MSLIKELAKENLLFIALTGVRGVLERELDIKDILFTMSENYKQDLIRRAETKGEQLSFPWSYFKIQSLAGSRDTTNNYAIRKHGVRVSTAGELATSKKIYLFPVKLGLEFHYIDTDPRRLLTMAQTLVLLSSTGGLKFQIDVGDMYSFTVGLEIPLDSTIDIQEEQNPQLPEATDIVTQIIMSSEIGFFRDVSAVNGQATKLRVSLQSNGQTEEVFEIEGPSYVQPW
jgi:hypothetical protein